jgi:hypothetical protein
VFIRLTIMTAGVLVALMLSFVLAAAQSTRQPQQTYAAASAAQQGQLFEDPHGQYRLYIPPGWEVSQSGDGPIFRNGTSWIQVRFVTASSAGAAVDHAVDLFRSQFTSFNTINRGNTTIADRASYGLNVDGMTTGGQRVSVLLTAQPQGKRQYFVLVSATPVAQAPQLNTSVMALANSVRFSGE